MGINIHIYKIVEIKCDSMSANNSDMGNATVSYSDSVIVTCDEDFFAFGDLNITEYETFCLVNKTFLPFSHCNRKYI